MEPKIWPEPFDDEDYAFQVKWDGTRILAHIGEGRVELFNRKGRRRTEQYPEVVEALRDLITSDAILDGEIIALGEDGKPSFHQVMRRDRSSETSTISYLRRTLPVTFVIFDVLVLDGEELFSNPFRKRDEILKSLIKSQDPVVVTDTFPTQGTGLFSVVESRGLEGIVAKRWDSPYIFGKKSDHWLKIKRRQKLICTVGGFTEEGSAVRSLLLGIFQGDDLVYIGRAGSGLTQDEARELHRKLSSIKTNHSPFSSPLTLTGSIHWVKPEVKIPVEYMDLTEDGLLRHSVIKL